MVEVEAVELAVAHEVDAGLLLRVQHHPRCVEQRLVGGRRDEPVRDRVGADDGGLDQAIIIMSSLDG